MWPETGSEWAKYIVGAILTGLAVLFAIMPTTQDLMTLIPAVGAAIVAYLMTMLGINRPAIAETERIKAIAFARREIRAEERAQASAQKSPGSRK